MNLPGSRKSGPRPSSQAYSPLPFVRWSRRRFLGSLVAAGVALASVRSSSARAVSEPAGLIALPRGREIALIKPDGTESRTVISLAAGEFIADVALSPDRSKLAFGLFTARTGEGAGGSDIVVASVENPTERTVVVPRDRPGTLLAAPQWAPDGQSLVFEAVGLTATGQAAVTAEWVAVDGSGRRTVAQSARYPGFSPDGSSVVYTRALPTGDALWSTPVAGGEGREIVPDSQFLVVVYPRFSPDGTQIAFGGVSDTLPVAPGLPGTQTPPTRPPTPKLLPGTVDWGASAVDPFRPRTVAAHGFPAEPFVVSPSGAGARLLAQLPIDDAAVAWSPDGGWVAVSGASGLFLVNVADGETRRISENGSFGAIDWR
jgi:Tol biopolymer transport system component